MALKNSVMEWYVKQFLDFVILPFDMYPLSQYVIYKHMFNLPIYSLYNFKNFTSGIGSNAVYI